MAGKQDKDKKASYRKPLSIPETLFVLRSLCTDRKTNDLKRIYDHLKEDGDTTDMSSSGYTLTDEKLRSYVQIILAITSGWSIMTSPSAASTRPLNR